MKMRRNANRKGVLKKNESKFNIKKFIELNLRAFFFTKTPSSGKSSTALN